MTELGILVINEVRLMDSEMSCGIYKVELVSAPESADRV